MLRKRNFNLASGCAMCLEEEESIYHFFVHCRWELIGLNLLMLKMCWLQGKRD